MTLALLEAFAKALNRSDIDGLLALGTPDCVFESAFCPAACGTRDIGHAELRDGYSKPWRTWPDAQWQEATHVIAGDRGFSEWTLRGTGPSGGIEVRGCDLFVIRDDKIARKDSLRKQRA